ncbi:MAG TPA: polysaccharide biosynthesis/export family protein [Allosphingosinicella sp.]|jgi:polysaccharide export outer membrane protein
MIVFGSSSEPARAVGPIAAARRRVLAFAQLLLALFAFSLVAACATRGGDIPYPDKAGDFVAPDAPSARMGPTEDYRISPLDKLQVTVFQVPDLTRDVDVDLGGNITMPLIGSVRAVDLTTAQLQDRLEQQLGERYLRNPDVTVTVRESSRRHITVDGAVRQPGQFQINGPTTLLQAVALARGTDETANPRRVAVFRQIQGQRMAAAFDLTAIRRGNAEDPVIYTGDIIVVDGSRLRALQREIMSTIPLLTIFRPF